MTKEEILVILNDHEWIRRAEIVYCPTCGNQFRQSLKVWRHKPDCKFSALYTALQNGTLIVLHRSAFNEAFNAMLEQNYAKALDSKPKP